MDYRNKTKFRCPAAPHRVPPPVPDLTTSKKNRSWNYHTSETLPEQYCYQNVCDCEADNFCSRAQMNKMCQDCDEVHLCIKEKGDDITLLDAYASNPEVKQKAMAETHSQELHRDFFGSGNSEQGQHTDHQGRNLETGHPQGQLDGMGWNTAERHPHQLQPDLSRTPAQPFNYFIESAENVVVVMNNNLDLKKDDQPGATAIRDVIYKYKPTSDQDAHVKQELVKFLADRDLSSSEKSAQSRGTRNADLSHFEDASQNGKASVTSQAPSESLSPQMGKAEDDQRNTLYDTTESDPNCDDLNISFDEESMSPPIKAELKELVKEIRTMRANNAKLRETVKNNECIIDQLLTTQTADVKKPEPGAVTVPPKSTGKLPRKQRLANLAKFITERLPADLPEVKQTLHLIEAQDIEGLGELVNKDILEMFDVHDDDDKDTDEALERKLGRLRRDITDAYRGELGTYKVSYVLHLIDARDIMGLYETLTPEALHKYKLLDAADEFQAEQGLDNDVREAVMGHLGDFTTGTTVFGGGTVDDNQEQGNVKEIQVQTGRGHCSTIRTSALDPVTGLHVLPGLNCLVVAHFKHSKIWIYSEEGTPLGSFNVPKLYNPSGMAGFTTKENAVLVADFSGKTLHEISLKMDEDGKLALAHHTIWKLPFRPCDVTSLGKVFATPNMADNAIHILDENGTYINKVDVRGRVVNKLYSVVGNRICFLVVDCDNQFGGVHWVNTSGDIFCSYGMNKGDHRVMSSMHAIHDTEDRAIVADHNGHRIILIGKNGEFKKFLLQAEDGIFLPRRMHLYMHEGKPRLIVGYGRSFDIKIRIYDYDKLCSAEIEDVFKDTEQEVQPRAETEAKEPETLHKIA